MAMKTTPSLHKDIILFRLVQWDGSSVGVGVIIHGCGVGGVGR